MSNVRGNVDVFLALSFGVLLSRCQVLLTYYVIESVRTVESCVRFLRDLSRVHYREIGNRIL